MDEELPEWKQRLREECKEVADRTEKLVAFIASPSYNVLPSEDRALLVAQRGAMTAYGAVLLMRGRRAGVIN